MDSSKMELEDANSHQLWTNMLGQPVFSCSLNTTYSSFFPYLHSVSPFVCLTHTAWLNQQPMTAKANSSVCSALCVCAHEVTLMLL